MNRVVFVQCLSMGAVLELTARFQAKGVRLFGASVTTLFTCIAWKSGSKPKAKLVQRVVSVELLGSIGNSLLNSSKAS